MKCPVCGALELIHDTRDLPYTYKGETTAIAAVTGDFCPACGESILDATESNRVMREMRAFSRQVNAAIVDPEAKDDNDPHRMVAAEQLKAAHAVADYNKWFRAQVQASIDDPRPNISAEDARKKMLNKREELQSPLLYKADAVVLNRVVAGKELPFAIKAPNATSRVAFGEASEIIDGRRARFATADALIDNIEKASDQQEGALERMAVNARELGLDY